MILHVDMNSFYASCAVMKSGGLYTFETPLMVCGDPKKRHGIVLAATYPVKKTGVRAGMPLWEAKQRCPNAVVVEPDFRLYMDYSNRFMHIIRSYSPLIMRYGIDEAYIDYSGCEHIFGPPETVAEIIRERVKRELGLTVSVGIGENLIMAKMGSDYKKPDAITSLNRESWKKLIWPLPASNLMYVGKATERKLGDMGVRTIGQLAGMSLELLKSIFGKSGADMWMHANGMDNTHIKYVEDPQKGIGSSMTLPQDVTSTKDLLAALLLQTEKVAYRLRQAGMRARVIAVHVRFDDLTSRSCQTTLEKPTDITQEIYNEARLLIPRLMIGRPVRQAGIRVAKLTSEGEQISLMDAEHREKLHRLDAATDAMRAKYGSDVLMRGSTMRFEQDEFDEFSPFVKR
ncbi:MAG: DNA polymerase IV [Clostridia bacterium]